MRSRIGRRRSVKKEEEEGDHEEEVKRCEGESKW